MKHLFYAILFIAITGFVSCGADKTSTKEIVEEKTIEKDVETIITSTEKTETEGTAKTIAKLEIKGMTCAMGCANTIEKKLNNLTGVTTAEVLFEEEYAIVEYDDKVTSEKEIIAVIQEAGEYQVPSVSIEKTVIKATAF